METIQSDEPSATSLRDATARKLRSQGQQPDAEEPSFLAVLTLVLWLMALAIGLLGLWLSRTPPQPPKPEPPPLRAEASLDVAITNEQIPTAVEESSPAAEEPPVDPIFQPPLPTARQRWRRQARLSRSRCRWTARCKSSRPGVQHTVRPHNRPRGRCSGSTTDRARGSSRLRSIPSAAVLERQEGVVGIRFAVGEDGRVLKRKSWCRPDGPF